MMSEAATELEVIEGTAVAAYVAPPAPAALFGTTDPVEVIERATAIADALKDVIAKKGLFSRIQGKEHILVEGWQLLGSMLGITAVCVGTEQVEGGWKATVEARTADGRVVGRADALCTKLEKRGPWKTADDYARLSMAQTRATSKALKGPLGFVVSLAGYATTPAEEMTFVEPDQTVEQASGLSGAPERMSGSRGSTPAPTPAEQSPVERVTEKDVAELKAAAKGLAKPEYLAKLQMCFSAVELPQPTVVTASMFGDVPRSKVAELVAQLSAVER